MDIKAIPFTGFMIDSVASSEPHLLSSMRTMSHKIFNSMIFSMRAQPRTQGGNLINHLMKMRTTTTATMAKMRMKLISFLERTNLMSLEDLETILKTMIRI